MTNFRKRKTSEQRLIKMGSRCKQKQKKKKKTKTFIGWEFCFPDFISSIRLHLWKFCNLTTFQRNLKLYSKEEVGKVIKIFIQLSVCGFDYKVVAFFQVVNLESQPRLKQNLSSFVSCACGILKGKFYSQSVFAVFLSISHFCRRA
jgi:hypothetical protein